METVISSLEELKSIVQKNSSLATSEIGAEIIHGETVEWIPEKEAQVLLELQKKGFPKIKSKWGIRIAKALREIDALLFPDSPAPIYFFHFPELNRTLFTELGLVEYYIDSSKRGLFTVSSPHEKEAEKLESYNIFVTVLGKQGILSKLVFFLQSSLIAKYIVIHEARHRVQSSGLIRRNFGEPFEPKTDLEREFLGFKKILQEVVRCKYKGISDDALAYEIDAFILANWWRFKGRKLPTEQLAQILLLEPQKPL